MSERQDDEPIFGQDDVDPWIEALDNVLQKQKQEQEPRVRARGTTPPPGVPFSGFAEATVVTPALEPLPPLPVEESEPVAVEAATPAVEPVDRVAEPERVERVAVEQSAPLSVEPAPARRERAAVEPAVLRVDRIAEQASPVEQVAPAVRVEQASPGDQVTLALPVMPPPPVERLAQTPAPRLEPFAQAPLHVEAPQPSERATPAPGRVAEQASPVERATPPQPPRVDRAAELAARPAEQAPRPVERATPPPPPQPRVEREPAPVRVEHAPRPVERTTPPPPPQPRVEPAPYRVEREAPTAEPAAQFQPAAQPAEPFGPVPVMPRPLVHEAPTPRIEAGAYVTRTRMWSFVVDEVGRAIELGSGRFAKAFLGEERWLESKTRFTRPIAIKCLQRGVTGVDVDRFQIEKTILERVQGHPNIIELMGSGESGSPGCSETFIPPNLRDKVVNDFMILELLDGSLEDLLRGARNKRRRDDLLSLPNPERLFRVLDYVLPVATGVEFAHLVRDVCHRDIKPANILVKLPESSLRGSQLKVKLADFNVGNLAPREERLQAVPGTLYFQSPEQATNTFEVLCNCTHGSAEVQLFEDFYIDISRNDGFSLFNHAEQYQVIAADRVRKRILLDRPWAERHEVNVRGQIIKAVGRPADVYSVGALLYYLISGATANPKALYDSFKRFAEYDREDESNTIAAYLEHQYKTIASMRAPKPVEQANTAAPEVAFEDRFFSYKQYLDGNGELIDQKIMLLVAKAMIRNKPDSYCFAHDVQSEGISTFVHDLLALYVAYGVDPHARYARTTDYHPPRKAGPMRRAFDRLFTRGD